jgi:hypothetical protein
MIRTAARIADEVILHHGVSPDLIERALGWLDNESIEASCWTPYSLEPMGPMRGIHSWPRSRGPDERQGRLVRRL